ncbi:hypothetical protein ACFFX0_15665 [Citricoccus parietis]|uniref:Uncharacterized protein n=1 Tax=Citricoccus parietis TaxID=592307 RepID=A0ABV5G0U9_9MICC
MRTCGPDSRSISETPSTPMRTGWRGSPPPTTGTCGRVLRNCSEGFTVSREAPIPRDNQA